jgi:phosphoenolpyruvate-protein kinase (PTS system EI component)
VAPTARVASGESWSPTPSHRPNSRNCSERGVVAIVTAQGSPLSHSAILARSLHLPLVVGATKRWRTSTTATC